MTQALSALLAKHQTMSVCRHCPSGALCAQFGCRLFDNAARRRIEQVERAWRARLAGQKEHP